MATRKILVFNPDTGIAEEQQAGDTAAFGGPVDFGGQTLSNLSDPVSAQDAATKAYVDAHGGGSSGGSGIIIGHGAPTDPPPAANYLFFDQDSATVYTST